MSIRHTWQYPSRYFKIADKTLRLGYWEMELPTVANANSFKTTWHHYVRALEREQNFTDMAAARRVVVRTKGNVVIFEDREKTYLAKALDEAFKNEPKSEAEIELDKVRNKE